jgi:O-antigen/teichoic acid export membrane protein
MNKPLHIRTNPSLKTNYLFNTSLTISNILFPIITFSYVARVFGPEILGKINFIASLAGFFSLIASFGLSIYGTSVIAKERDDQSSLNNLFSEFLSITFLSSMVSTVFYLSLFLFLPKLKNDLGLFLIYGSNVLFTFMSIDWLYQGFEKYQYITIRNIVSKIAFLGSIVLIIRNKGDFLLFGGIVFLSFFIPNLHGLYRARTLVNFRPDFLAFKKHVRVLLINSSSLITVSIYVVLDNAILGFLAGDIYVGYYSTAMKITRIITAVSTSVATVLLPRLSYYIENNQIDEFNSLAKKSLHFIYLIALPSFFGVIILAPAIIACLAGKQFSQAVSALRIAAVIIPVVGLTNLIGLQVLIPLGKLKEQFFATFIAAIASVGLYLLLIPIFKHNGAALATAIAEAIVLAVQLVYVRRGLLVFRLFDRVFARYACMSLIMAAALLGVFHFITLKPLFLLIAGTIIGAGIYFFGLVLMKDALVGDVMGMIFKAFGRVKSYTH